jgi:hypothetical protein
LESLSTKMNLVRSALTVVLGTCLMIGCIDTRSQECRSFLALPAVDQHSVFQQKTLSKQMDLCLCALRQEPPDLQLAYEISDRGEEAIPVLKEKLANARDEVDQHDIIFIFELMSRKGYLRGKSELITEIRDVVDAMTIAPVKEDATAILKKIQINTGIKSITYVQ